MGPSSMAVSAQPSVDRGSDSADGKKSTGKDAGAADARRKGRGVQKAKDPKKTGRKANAEARNSKQGGAPADQMQ